MKHIKNLCQATLRVLLAVTMIFSTGITGVFADEQSSNLNEALSSQNVIANNLDVNKASYENALNVLSDAQELDGNDPAILIGHIDYIINDAGENQDLENLKSLISDAQDLNTKYSQLTDEEKITYNDSFAQALLNSYNNYEYNDLSNYYAQISNVLLDIGLDDAVSKIADIASDNSASEIYINGLQMDVNNLTGTVYVGYMVEDLEVLVIPNQTTTNVEIFKPNPLVVGNNEVKIIITSLDGQIKEYIFNVIRQNEFAEQGDATGETTNVVALAATPQEENVETTDVVTTTNTSSYSSSTTVVENDTNDEEESTDEQNTKKYDEELEEEKGLNGFTVLLIVAGIVLIGFGIYMLFGDKDDNNVPKIKEVKSKSKPINSKKKK